MQLVRFASNLAETKCDLRIRRLSERFKNFSLSFRDIFQVFGRHGCVIGQSGQYAGAGRLIRVVKAERSAELSDFRFGNLRHCQRRIDLEFAQRKKPGAIIAEVGMVGSVAQRK